MTMANVRGRALTASLGLALVLGLHSEAVANSGTIRTGDRTTQPIGHFEFCKKNPDECAIKLTPSAPVVMTEMLQEKLAAINVAVNTAIQPMNDIDLFGKAEVWTYPDQAGDCEDYVLQKRRLLEEEGIPLSNLLITVVRKSDGEGHAVLTVRTDQGDYVLDNLNNKILPWEQTGYLFLKRQSTEDTGLWVAIRDGDTPLVGSVK
jgi:predicted transglutaminase-like cysteine proteinase